MSARLPQDEARQIRDAIQQASAAGDARALVRESCRLAGAAARPGDYAFAAARLRELQTQGARSALLKPLRTYVARSVTVEPFLPQLMVHAAAAGLWLDITVGGYGSFIDDLMNPSGALHALQPDLVLFLAELEDLAGSVSPACSRGVAQEVAAEVDHAVHGIGSMLQAFRQHSSAGLLVQGLVIPDQPVLGEVGDSNLAASEAQAIRQINQAMSEMCRKLGNAVYFDQDHLAARAGRAKWRDKRMFLASRLAIAPDFFVDYCRGLARSVRALYFPSKKVLCTDLDGTLWGGIVGEDGPEGITTGATFPGSCYYQYQKYLKALSARGVLLAIASKNNEADVREAFQSRSGDLALKLEDFVAAKISWNDKAIALRELAEELSLGLDSFVFVDDNPAECEAIRQNLPEVQVVEVPRDEPWTLADKIAGLGAFDTLSITHEDQQRNEEYRAMARRSELEASAGSREDFLSSLNIVCTVIDALDAPLGRTVQLIGKTNQFNLTTRRHSATDVQRFAESPGGQALALRARDRFGDSGVVGIALCHTQQGQCHIDTFLLSCRVIGRGVESALLWYLAQQAQRDGASHLVGEFIPTAKNKPCADFYSGHGFRRLQAPPGGSDSSASVFYEFDLSQGLPPKPWWITIQEETKKHEYAAGT